MVKTYLTVYCRSSHSLSEPIPSSPIYKPYDNDDSKIIRNTNTRIRKPPLLNLGKANKTDCSKNLSFSILLSSSPVKRPPESYKLEEANIPAIKTKEENFQTVKSDAGFTINTSMIPTPEPKREIALIEKVIDQNVPKTYLVDDKLNNPLQEFCDKGKIDLAMDDITYFNQSTSGKDNPLKINLPHEISKQIKFQIFITGPNAEALIGLPATSCTLYPDTKLKLMEYLRKTLCVQNQNQAANTRKRKVVILAPRSEASWFQRKLRTLNMKFLDPLSDYEFIQVKFPKSFISSVKEHLANLFEDSIK